MAFPKTNFGDSVHALVGRNKECKGEQGTQHCAALHPMAHTLPPLSNKEHRSSPPTALSPTRSQKFCIDLMAGWVARLLHPLPPTCSGALAPICMPRVCCSLICFSTPLRTADCVQYNSVLWPTLASLLLLQSSDFTGARKWRQWAPPPTAPQLLLCTPRTPRMTNDPGGGAAGLGKLAPGHPSILGSYQGFWAA